VRKPKIAVIGSINMDLITTVDRIPNFGETILGKSFAVKPGGKGANQAIASAKLGAEVYMFGCIGDDLYGKEAIKNLKENHVNTSHIKVLAKNQTGVATITVKDGENFIAVIPNANYCMMPEIIQEHQDILASFDVILASLEIPLVTVEKAINIAYENKVPFILNPAPAKKISLDILEKVTILTPNEHEIFGVVDYENTQEDFIEMLKKIPNDVVMTKGEEGAYIKTEENKIEHIESYEVDVVDSTGAGDAFNAGLAYKIGTGKSLRDSTSFAVAVGALAVTKLGAQEALPTMASCRKFLKEKN